MDQHLNLFRFYNENPGTEFIENNLSRAFSLCLLNNSSFFSEYIKSIVTKEDFEYLFSMINEDTQFEINLQVDTSLIDRESFKVVYAVAMTTNKELDMTDFYAQPEYSDKKNITDIFITIKDIAIIIEVKRTGEDCKAQLYNQVLPFIKDKYVVIPKRFSWQENVRLMEKVMNVQRLMSKNCIFLSDFLKLSESRYPDWFESKPFNLLPFTSIKGTTGYVQLVQRMRQALSLTSYDVLDYNRLGVSVKYGWASEIVPDFINSECEEYVGFYVWPGNTKAQGSNIYNKNLDWQNKGQITIAGIEFELEITKNIKFCHFNRFVSEINYYQKDVFKPLHTSENYYRNSGKWDWDSINEKWIKGDSLDYEKFMDEHFKPEFNWREHCDWTKNFINTDRTYFTISLGYEVIVYVPYSEFKNMDKNENDIVNVSEFINQIAEELKNLI